VSGTALVTGFPRQLSRLVAAELAARWPGELALLVRPRYLDDARRFVAGLPRPATVIEGDVTAIDLGLAGGDYLALARRVTVIHHAAQSTWEAAPAGTVAALHTQGTHEVLEFVATARGLGRCPRLVAYSSTLVAGDHEGLVREGDLDFGQGFRSEVERSLYAAERRLRRAAEGGPVTVVRPSIMVGHSVTGEIDVLDGPYLYLAVLLESPVDLTLPLPARGANTLHVVPVDHVARAGVCLADIPHEGLRTFHVVDRDALPARRVFELVAAAAGRRFRVSGMPVGLARAVLRTPGVDRLARSPRAFFERLATRTVYDDAGAHGALAAAGIACPPFGDYVGALVRAARERLRARRVRPDAVAQEPEIDDPLA
jgi:thioester reductase-like protein